MCFYKKLGKVCDVSWWGPENWEKKLALPVTAIIPNSIAKMNFSYSVITYVNWLSAK